MTIQIIDLTLESSQTVELTLESERAVELIVSTPSPPGPQGPPGPAGQQGSIEEQLLPHINSPTPHPAYDDIPSLILLFENGLA